MGINELKQALKPFCEKINNVIENDNEISVITHLDADGIISGKDYFYVFNEIRRPITVRSVSDMTLNVIEQMKFENHDFYIITDLGGRMAKELLKALDKRWVAIDHHQIYQEETTDYNDQVLNAWKFGINGGNEICAGGMAYMVASTLDRKNRDLSSTAIVSALADRQDQGDKRSLLGVNSEIVKIAQSLGLISVDFDLMFTGRETRPLHESLAYTSSPYIEGLTWNIENCYEIIKNAGIKMKDNGRWRVLSEISNEEKSFILDAIAKFVVTSSKYTATDIKDNLIGYTYTLTNEDQRSQLRDAREFSIMLNACGRIRKAGVGIGICMGDRNTMLTEGEEIVDQYRTTLRNYISTIFAEKWRLIDNGNSVFVNGEGLLAEDMLGAVSSLLGGSPTLCGRLLFVRTITKDGNLQVFFEKMPWMQIRIKSRSNNAILFRIRWWDWRWAFCSAGCRIPSARLEDFLQNVRIAIDNAKFETAS